MSEKERLALRDKIWKGLELAEHRMLREKALRNETVIQGDERGNIQRISARKLLKEIYNEDVCLPV